MSDGTEIDRFVKTQSLLVELRREVVEELDSGIDDSDARATRTSTLRNGSPRPCRRFDNPYVKGLDARKIGISGEEDQRPRKRKCRSGL